MISDQLSPERNIYGDNDRDQYFRTGVGMMGLTHTQPLNTKTYIKSITHLSKPCFPPLFGRTRDERRRENPPSGLVLAAKSLLAGARPARFAPRDFGSTRVHSIPLHFLHAILYGGRNPGRNPRKTRSCGPRRHGQPAPIAHPRCRRAPGIPGGEPARWGGHPRRLSP